MTTSLIKETIQTRIKELESEVDNINSQIAEAASQVYNIEDDGDESGTTPYHHEETLLWTKLENVKTQIERLRLEMSILEVGDKLAKLCSRSGPVPTQAELHVLNNLLNRAQCSMGTQDNREWTSINVVYNDGYELIARGFSTECVTEQGYISYFNSCVNQPEFSMNKDDKYLNDAVWAGLQVIDSSFIPEHVKVFMREVRKLHPVRLENILDTWKKRVGSINLDRALV